MSETYNNAIPVPGWDDPCVKRKHERIGGISREDGTCIMLERHAVEKWNRRQA